MMNLKLTPDEAALLLRYAALGAGTTRDATTESLLGRLTQLAAQGAASAKPLHEVVEGVVMSVYGFTFAQLRTADREQYITEARHVAMFLLLRAGYPTTASARMVARNHSSAIHARTRIDNLLFTRHPRTTYARVLMAIEMFEEAKKNTRI